MSFPPKKYFLPLAFESHKGKKEEVADLSDLSRISCAKVKSSDGWLQVDRWEGENIAFTSSESKVTYRVCRNSVESDSMENSIGESFPSVIRYY